MSVRIRRGNWLLHERRFQHKSLGLGSQLRRNFNGLHERGGVCGRCAGPYGLRVYRAQPSTYYVVDKSSVF